MKIFIISLSFLFLSINAISQNTTIINPDGTITTQIHQGNITTIINPDGTITTQIHHGDMTTQVNPNGSTTVQVHHGNMTTQVNPDGSTTNIINQENPILRGNSNGNIGSPNEQLSTPQNIDTSSIYSQMENEFINQPFIKTDSDGTIIHQHELFSIYFYTDGTTEVIRLKGKAKRKMLRKRRRRSRKSWKIDRQNRRNRKSQN